MNNNWIVVCLLTEGPYELEFSTHLLPSLQKFNIPYHIEVIESKGSWLKNVAQKPGAIYNAMEKYPSKNIVCLDADSEIVSYPSLFDTIPEEYDLSFHTLHWNSWYANESNVNEVLSGTIFLRNNEKVRKLVEDWFFKANNTPIWEQKVLASLLEERKDVHIHPLPIEYCYIFSLPNGEKPLIKIDNPVIVHYQKSRIYKKLIK